jgi:hypothetical protein
MQRALPGNARPIITKCEDDSVHLLVCQYRGVSSAHRQNVTTGEGLKFFHPPQSAVKRLTRDDSTVIGQKASGAVLHGDADPFGKFRTAKSCLVNKGNVVSAKCGNHVMACRDGTALHGNRRGMRGMGMHNGHQIWPGAQDRLVETPLGAWFQGAGNIRITL